MRVLISVVLALLSVVAIAQEKLAFNLAIGNDTYSFMPVIDSRQLASLYGAYQAPMSDTQGTFLRIYPNKKFTFIEWCDICPESLLATGTYSFSNGIFAFSYIRKKKGLDTSRLPTELVAFHGWIDKKTYVTGSEYILISPSDVAKAQSDTRFVRYLRQSTWYPDWQKMYDHDVASKEKDASRQ